MDDRDKQFLGIIVTYAIVVSILISTVGFVGGHYYHFIMWAIVIPVIIYNKIKSIKAHRQARSNLDP
jgi:hypothetical protein